jgi:alcohol dehydrogenase
MMQAMIIEKYGKFPIKLADIPMPAVGDHDVLVEIHAASINPLDLLVRDGKLRVLLKYDMPHILGYDFSGIVVQVGRKVGKCNIGDAIYGRPSKGGAFAEYLSVHENDIALKPKNLSFVEAASIPEGLDSSRVGRRRHFRYPACQSDGALCCYNDKRRWSPIGRVAWSRSNHQL